MKRVLKVLGILVLVLVLGVVITGLVMHESRPDEGETGEYADALARRMVASVDGCRTCPVPALHNASPTD